MNSLNDDRAHARPRSDAPETVRLLLINPRFPESFWSFKWALADILTGKRSLNPPLGLATLAALCPPHWEVEIVDENIESIPLAPRADIVGVCGMGVQFKRQQELLGYYRAKGYYAVAGGSYASLCPERYAPLADTVIAGEAEYVWTAFCRDFERGAPRPLYRETGIVSLADSPPPRFDLLKLDQYSSVSVQFSRGCPYRCEFCDIIVMFGRKPRTKSPEQIGRELDALRAHGVRSVFFVDDNLIGHRPAARALLRYLVDYQRRHGRWFRFGTEASLNLAQDEELLQLFRDAGFEWVFIGIESPDEASLKETGKTQNLRQDMLASVRRLYGHGIDVLAGFIVGFDNDSLETFERQHRFIMASGIQVAMIGLLTALPKTPLYERLQKAGRLLAEQDGSDNTKPATNILPRHMRYDEMVRAFQALYARLFAERAIAERIENKLAHLARPVYRPTFTWTQQLGLFGRLLTKGILPGGPRRIGYFVRTLCTRAPWRRAAAIRDWVAGLALRDYIERHFADPGKKENHTIRKLPQTVERALAAHRRQGALELSWRHTPRAGLHLLLGLKGRLDARFFSQAGRHLVKLLKRTRITVRLRVEALSPQERPELERLLRRLARWGDRIYIEVNERLRDTVSVDSSIFHLVLRRETPSASPAC